MTRRKDTIRNKTERIRISQQKRESRLEKRKQENEENEKEKLQEKQLLCQVAELPPELIRLIYGFMSGNAKLIFFPKYESLYRNCCPFDFEMRMERLFGKMTNDQILDLIYTGTLLKYPEIIGTLSYDYYYSLIDHDFHTVTGYQLLNLWSSGKMSYDFMRGDYSMDEGVKIVIDKKTRERIAAAMKNYIWNTISEYRNIHRQVCYLASRSRSSKDNKKPDSYRDLFLDVEKALYLFRVASRFLPPLEKDLPIKTPSFRTDQIFVDELLIPTPSYTFSDTPIVFNIPIEDQS